MSSANGRLPGSRFRTPYLVDGSELSRKAGGALPARGCALPRRANVRPTSRRNWCVAGDLPIPDPRSWPAEIRKWFREITAGAGPRDVFIFERKAAAEMYLVDAVTALGVLDVSPSEWHTDEGFPLFRFRRSRIEEFRIRLAMCGYTVRVFVEASPSLPLQSRRARVVDISTSKPPSKDRRRRRA
jgi:hypothetical protein